MKTGSIVLASVRSFGGIVPLEGRFSIQLLSANLSADTTFNLQFSLDKTNWCNAQEAGTDVTFILVNSTTIVRSYEADSTIYWRVLAAGATTGTVNYIIS